jgi:uncharacterized protein
LIGNTYTGEESIVSIDPDKRDLFLETGIFQQFPDACPFLRFNPLRDMSCCTIHQTRPEICRDYLCWRLLILNHQGRVAGKIRYGRSLCSEDAILLKIWENCIEHYEEPDNRIWEDTMIRTLGRAGYAVRK